MSEECINPQLARAHAWIRHVVGRHYLSAMKRGIHHPRIFERIVRLLSTRDWEINW
jgi:hypothetical protein